LKRNTEQCTALWFEFDINSPRLSIMPSLRK